MKQLSFSEYTHYFNERVSNYIPAQSEWTPVDEALYAPDDLYRVPLDEGRRLQLAAIRHTFARHYRQNEIYRNYCRKHQVVPEDIQTETDLVKIPLIPDSFFKDYPQGKPFATWLGNLFTGELPRIVIRQRQPSHDQVVDAFNRAGLVVTYSSGTGGRHTFIPRDRRTFNNSQYALAKTLISMSGRRWVYTSDTYLMMPDPRLNALFAGKALEILFDMVDSARVAIPRRISISLLSMTMSGKGGLKGKLVRLVSRYHSRKMTDKVIDWLHQRKNATESTFIFGAPYLIHAVLQKLKQQGQRFDFGERGGVVTGGGWKIREHERLSAASFRRQVQDVLGIPERYCLDVYGMVEGNGWMTQCPEGHYLHVPYTYFKPLVLDDALKPVPAGTPGRFAFLDASALSYPGFIMTGDQVRLLERCPVCDRPGPVLEPEIRRMSGQGERGCADEVRMMFDNGPRGKTGPNQG